MVVTADDARGRDWTPVIRPISRAPSIHEAGIELLAIIFTHFEMIIDELFSYFCSSVGTTTPVNFDDRSI